MTALTLKAFFCDDPSSPIYSACEAAAAEQVVEAAMQKVPAPLRTGLKDSVRSALDEVFNVPLADVLASSWKKVAGIRDAIEATRADAAKVVFVPLLEHKISSRHQPHIDLVTGGKAVIRLPLDIVLTLELKGVELEVRAGRIAALRSGECCGNGVFSFEGQELIRKVTPAFGLPGRVAFAMTAD